MRPSILAPNVTPMARARTPTNGLKILVAASKIAVIEGALNWGVGHLLYQLPTTKQWPRAWSRTVESNHQGAATNRTRRPLRPALREQRDEPRNDVRHDCERGRVEHVRRLYHSRPADVINRSAATVITTTTSVTKSDSATRPPIYGVDHRQCRNVHQKLHDSALILHSANISATATDRQVDSDPRMR